MESHIIVILNVQSQGFKRYDGNKSSRVGDPQDEVIESSCKAGDSDAARFPRSLTIAEREIEN